MLPWEIVLNANSSRAATLICGDWGQHVTPSPRLVGRMLGLIINPCFCFFFVVVLFCFFLAFHSSFLLFHLLASLSFSSEKINEEERGVEYLT